MMDSLRNLGRIKGGQWYEHDHLGCNYRITQLQVALLSEQFNSPLTRGHGETLHTYHIYIFRYDSKYFNYLPKGEFAEMLAAEGVPSFMGYPELLYKQPVFQQKNFMRYAIPENVDYKNVHCTLTEKACYEEVVWITQNAMLGTKEDMDKFRAAIRKIQQISNQ